MNCDIENIIIDSVDIDSLSIEQLIFITEIILKNKPNLYMKTLLNIIKQQCRYLSIEKISILIYYIMNSNILRISEVMEDIKQNITNNQYKTIMESSMEINKETNFRSKLFK